MFGLVLMLCALGFKMSAAPFHMWTPDVYEGAPTPVTAFFAAAPKVAAVALMARRSVRTVRWSYEGQWQQVVAALSAISMVWGSIGALLQTNLKRPDGVFLDRQHGLRAHGPREPALQTRPRQLHSSIWRSICPRPSASLRSSSPCAANGEAVETDRPTSPAWRRRRPWMAALFTMLLFSVAGIPPFAGFIGKLLVFIGRDRRWPRMAGHCRRHRCCRWPRRTISDLLVLDLVQRARLRRALQPAYGPVIVASPRRLPLRSAFPILVLALGFAAKLGRLPR